MKFLNLLLIKSFFFNFVLSFSLDHDKFVKNPRIIFVDIGQTLIKVQKLKCAINYAGLGDLIANSCDLIMTGSFRVGQGTFDQYYMTLKKIPSGFKAPNYEILGLDGKPMAPLQRDSSLGKLSLDECIQIAEKWINQNPDEFKTKVQKRIFRKMLHFNFNAEIFIKYQKYTDTINLLKKLFSETNKIGKRKNICFIFSNQAKEVVEQLKINFSDIFKYSDLQIFSCFEGIMKIQPQVVKKYLSMCPENCNLAFVIDDETDNLKACSSIKFKNFKIYGVKP